MSIAGRSPTKILVALNIVVGVVMIGWGLASLRLEQENVPVPEDTPTELSPVMPKVIQTEALEAHPLFSSTRKPMPMEPTPDHPDPATLQPPPLLVGILRDSDSILGALLEDPQSGVRKFVRPNEELGAWTLASLRPKAVVLRSGSQEVELQLSFDSRSPPTIGGAAPTHTNP